MNEILLIDLVGFCVFMVLQALFINGMHELMKGGCIKEMEKGRKCSGMLFYELNPEFFERNKNKWWSRPAFSCIKCMSSVWSAITFWPVVIYIFRFHWVEIPVWCFDSICLVYLNYFFYKKL